MHNQFSLPKANASSAPTSRLRRTAISTSPDGTAEAVTTHYGYSQNCECDDVTSITDPLNHTTTLAYDDKKNLIGVTNPLNNTSTSTYNPAGQPLSVKDALNNTTQLTYENGDLVAVTDPRGQTGSAFIDSAGRLISSKTPNGLSSRYEYDSLNRPVRTIDPLGGVTEFTYDANSNLLSVKDARNNLTTYTYDNLNRLTSRTDPLQYVETYEYDATVMLKRFTDRRGKVTTYVFDNLYRVTFVGFGTTGDPANPTYESSNTYTYDAAGRLSQVTASDSGSISFSYDNFDRLTLKTTQQGTINYTYDAIGRQTAMTVSGQATVNYSYDNANRLTQIAQGGASINFSYDSASRITSISRSNGIVIDYAYDAASNLTGVTYKKDTSVLGNVTYEYNAAGKRTKVGGSFARTGLPLALTSATHNAANQLMQRGTTNLTYDNNGNLTSDGNNAYTWNARNQLASISGPGLTASFVYDASGARVNKTINGVSTSYLYDGANAVQELSGTTPTANIVNGGVDKVFTRTDGAGTRTPLTDGQGSILTLADDAGTLLTEHTYDPFGNTTSTGQSSSNSSKYTGREDDGTGLYYYRSRYYSPSLQRFISEDPLGFAGGDVNLYAYVRNDPINLVDPFGLCSGFVQQDIRRPVTLPAELSPIQFLKKTHAFSDAADVLQRDRFCLAFFARRSGSSTEALLSRLRALSNSAVFDPTREVDAITTHQGTPEAFITLSSFFFSDDTQRIYTWDPQINRWVDDYGLVARQHRAMTILHEFAHTLGIIPRDGRSVDPTGRQTELNDDTIYNNCWRGLSRLPSGIAQF